ncbi:hypothetical protein GCM10009808_26610 [Microbacterium sediminicola]|uniref:Fructose 1,6-bisphosphatase n=1 Tax=Microbacterium sediminicola TaxID=415210 RepID=A0ABP4ULA4_9MICO
MSLRLPARPALRRIAVGGAIIALGASTLTGCQQIIDAFNTIPGTTAASATATTDPQPASTDAVMDFDSLFSYDGSVTLVSDVATDLEVRLDVWAADPKRTREWTPDNEKVFGFAINVYDLRVDEKAVLTEKRRVYISSVAITSQTAQTSGMVSQPFQFSADPRTLVPTDTLRSDRGLLLNSYQGGLYVPEMSIFALPADTYGLTLQFAFTVYVEGTANDDTSFAQQTVYEYLPIAIYNSQGNLNISSTATTSP